jgi:hypothetical protein
MPYLVVRLELELGEWLVLALLLVGLWRETQKSILNMLTQIDNITRV